MSEIVLTKNSEPSDLKRYFEAILKLSEADEEFPVDLDEVWMLAYSERGKAVRALKQNFIEGDDYTTFAQTGKTATGGYKKVGYKLSVRCMEYFVARKVRPVFEVYRKVFHNTVEIIGMASVETKMKAAMWACDFLNLNDASRLMMARCILEPLGLPVPDYVQSKGVHHSASELLKENNIPLSSQAFNKLALAAGFIEQKTRKTRKGIKPFWVVSEKGLAYGENEVSDRNPNETQPHWYDSKFNDLLHEMGVFTQQNMF